MTRQDGPKDADLASPVLGLDRIELAKIIARIQLGSGEDFKRSELEWADLIIDLVRSGSSISDQSTPDTNHRSVSFSAGGMG